MAIQLTGMSPASPAAGNGPGSVQLVQLFGASFPAQCGVQFLPDAPDPVTGNIAPSYSGTIVTQDGSTLGVAIDLRGIVGSWHVRVRDLTTADDSPFLDFRTVAGAVTPYTVPRVVRHDPTRVSAVLETKSDSVTGLRSILTGGVSGVTVAGSGTGAPRGVAYPGPGILTWQNGAWQFTPVESLTLAQLNQMFPNVAGQPDLQIDPFGLPLPNAHQPYPVPVFRPDGTPVYSPWWAGRQAPLASAAPTTALPPSYQGYYPDAPAPIIPAPTDATIPAGYTSNDDGSASGQVGTIGGGGSVPVTTAPPTTGPGAPASSSGAMIVVVIVLVVVLMALMGGGK